MYFLQVAWDFKGSSQESTEQPCNRRTKEPGIPDEKKKNRARAPLSSPPPQDSRKKWSRLDECSSSTRIRLDETISCSSPTEETGIDVGGLAPALNEGRRVEFSCEAEQEPEASVRPSRKIQRVGPSVQSRSQDSCLSLSPP